MKESVVCRFAGLQRPWHAGLPMLFFRNAEVVRSQPPAVAAVAASRHRDDQRVYGAEGFGGARLRSFLFSCACGSGTEKLALYNVSRSRLMHLCRLGVPKGSPPGPSAGALPELLQRSPHHLEFVACLNGAVGQFVQKWVGKLTGRRGLGGSL